MWPIEKLLFMGNFSFRHNVFLKLPAAETSSGGTALTLDKATCIIASIVKHVTIIITQFHRNQNEFHHEIMENAQHIFFVLDLNLYKSAVGDFATFRLQILKISVNE